MSHSIRTVSANENSVFLTTQQLDVLLKNLEGNHSLEIKGELYSSIIKEVHASVTQLRKLQTILIKACKPSGISEEVSEEKDSTFTSKAIKITAKNSASPSSHRIVEGLFSQIKISKKK